ncbi:ABC transporter permease [Sporolactobacillus sp. CQH2019]|uniref:ABC transporter permease n=1 Tax=Sporolactobacillus sp. CQH2019 TaxID=3023512 RepID=UPI0023688B46|nr:ABC transporter permease [Sporolactobacillus sp. CQH2019]MDD9147211.1 ABC transporter permease [Sporolactobacillus sp. CQH2019]
MAIFQNNLKRFMKNKLTLGISLIIPILFIIVAFSGSGDQRATVGVIDHDGTQLTKQMIQTMKGQADVVRVTDNNQRDQLINGKADMVLIIDKGFTSSLIAGQSKPLNSYHVSESNISSGVSAFISGYLQDIELMAKQSQGRQQVFYQALNRYNQNHLALRVRSADGQAAQKEKTLSSLGFVIYGCLIMMIALPSKLIVEDKEKKIFDRFFTTPLSLRSYNAQHILSYLLLANVMIFTMLAILAAGFHATFGPSIFNVYVVLLIFSVVAISIGVALSVAVNSTRQANALTWLITTPLAMLGGCFWPAKIMPSFMQKLADFTPTAWGVKALTKLVYGNGLNDVIIELTILAAFAVIFFLLASWRTRDIAH